MKKIITILLGVIFLPAFVSAQLVTTQGGTGTTSPSGILFGDGTLHLKTLTIGTNLSLTGTTLNATSQATTTSIQWIDVNNSNSTRNGTISYPFNSVSGAISGAWSGAPAYAYYLAPGTYVDGAPDTFPNIPFYLSGNESTLVEPSGVTFPNSFDIYDLTIVGNVHESDNNLATIHQFNNGVISGNLQMDGLGLLSGMVVTGGNYFLISTSSLSNVTGTLVQNPVWANGASNFDDDEIATNTAGALITATTTSFTSAGEFGNINIVGATLINSSGPAINITNNATSTPNTISNLGMIVNSSHSLMVGNSKTAVCDLTQSVNLSTGNFVAPEASSSSSWIPCFDESLIVLGTSTIGDGTQAGGLTISGGATTTANAYFASKVGVAVQNPAYPLDVSGMIRGQSSTQFTGFIGYNGSNYFAKLLGNSASNDNGALYLLIGGVTKTELQASGSSFFNSGNVGVGSTTPWGLLSVAGSAGGSVPLFAVSSSTSASATTTVFEIDNNGVLTSNALATSSFSGGINLTSGCITYNGGACVGSSGSGTVTSVTLATPNSTLSLGGTNPVTTSGTINADLNLSHSNTWIATQNFTSASTTNFSVNGNEVSGQRYLSFKLGTSTAWIGTSTLSSLADTFQISNMPFTGSISQLSCGNDAGTLEIEGTDGSTHVYLSASTTPNYNTFSLSFTKGDTVLFQGGNPASSPTYSICTAIATGY